MFRLPPKTIRLILAAVLAGAVLSSVVLPPRSVYAGAPVTIITDLPAQLFRALDRAQKFIEKKLKFVNDQAFKHSLQVFTATLTKEALTYLSSGAAGQKPQFVQNIGTFLKDAGAAGASDYIDSFLKAKFGSRGPGTTFSEPRLRFAISRYLREAAFSGGTPVEQCSNECKNTYGIQSFVGPLPEGQSAEQSQNENTNNYAFIYNLLNGSGGTSERAEKSPDEFMVCKGTRFDVPAKTPRWVVDQSACVSGPPAYLSSAQCTVTAKECRFRQQQALLNLQADAKQQTNDCVKECRSGVAGALTKAIVGFTNKDVDSSIRNANPANAGKAIANALSGSKSEFGQLLAATAALEVAVQDRITGEQTKLSPGVLPRTTKVSGKVLTPSAAVSALFGVQLGQQGGESVYTGSPVDILKGVASFINSPVGKLFFNMFKSQCGLNPEACRQPYNPQSALGRLLFGQGAPTGTAGAAIQYATLAQFDFTGGEPGKNQVSVADELTTAGLIDPKFRSAIEEGVTVQEALSRGLLNSRATFGYTRNGDQPTSGYPFRALQYLRKFRVVPVGWELAAEYSRQFDPRDLSLGFLTKQFDRCGQDDNHRVCAGGAVPGQQCTADSDCGADDAGQPGRCTASPYCGLIDPNWVLKAPQTYCRRQGAGEEIVSKEFVCDKDNVQSAADDARRERGVQPGENPPDCSLVDRSGNKNDKHDIGRWVITRNTDTCADTQSCIAENDDGSCLAYGYCVQERPSFKFDGTKCSAENVSCTTYITDSGEKVSYLANSLDFRNCSADAAGCQWYCRDQNADGSWACSETSGNKINLTDQAQSCQSRDVGCRQFIRTTNGTNLLPNGGFEQYEGTGPTSIFRPWLKLGGLTTTPVDATDTSVGAGNKTALSITGSAGDGLTQTVDVGYPLYERSFTASLRARTDGACAAKLTLASDVGAPSTTMNLTASWETYSLTLTVPSEAAASSTSNQLTLTLSLDACPGGALLDSTQLEEAPPASSYIEYGSANNIYLNGQRQQCQPADVGCEKYTPLVAGPAVTAVARNSDRCSADKVGCATYHLEPIVGLPTRPAADVNIVAPRGTQCTAADVGCEEYTNLDLAAKGGEARQYFKSIKQCVKPTNTDATVSTYYTWVGSADKGFVLRAYDLAQSDIAEPSGGFAPCTNLRVASTTTNPTCDDANRVDTSAVCSATNFESNSDCAQYYDSALHAFYRLRSLTVSVTADCHPYRNTIDQQSSDPAERDRLYYLSPKENVACAAAAAGCRAYTGNAGRTTRQILSDTFEQQATNSWVGGTLATESVHLNGHSMKIAVPPSSSSGTGTAYTTPNVLQDQLAVGKTYLVSFIAAAAAQYPNPPAINVYFGHLSGTDFNGDAAFPGGPAQAAWSPNITPPGPEWRSYSFGPLRLDTQTFPLLGITTSGGDVYVDDVVLTEINDSIYLVSGSVPQCAASEIGCAAYRDRVNVTQYLKSFSRICAEQVVGCEALIDTQNSTSPVDQTVKGVTTPADQVVTYVNDRAVYCSAAAKGCDAFGQPVYGPDHALTTLETVYKINDPDRHQTDLCLNEEISCRAYSTVDGTAAFFKDPANRTCEFRADSSEAGGAWYVSGTSVRCPTTTPPTTGRPIGPSCSPVCHGGERDSRACLTDADCPVATGCSDGDPSTVCPAEVPKCVGDATKIGKVKSGSGYAPGQCSSDADCGDSINDNRCVYAAGLCPDEQNGCTEYRDPSDPASCRSECPLIQNGGSSIYLDATCTATRCVYRCTSGTCQGGPHDGTACSDDVICNINAGQNCQNSDQCGGGTCIGGNGETTTGLPGCRSYYYLRQTVEDTAADCNGQVDPKIGCRPFNDTTKTDLNFRGQ